MENNFEVGDEVRLVDYWDGLEEDSSWIMIGDIGKVVLIGTVAQVENGVLVEFASDGYAVEWWFWGDDILSYIEPAVKVTKLYRIEKKIKQMRERRKSLGYAW